MDETVKIISLHEPYASAVALGLKVHETRSFHTHYRGWLLVHAAKRWADEQDRSEAADVVRRHEPGWEPVLGRVVAVAWLASCLPTSPGGGLYSAAAEPDSDTDRLLGDWGPGRFAWRLENVRRLPRPVPWTGRQGLKIADPPLVGIVMGQLRAEAVSA